jgi:hypothetical protein
LTAVPFKMTMAKVRRKVAAMGKPKRGDCTKRKVFR